MQHEGRDSRSTLKSCSCLGKSLPGDNRRTGTIACGIGSRETHLWWLGYLGNSIFRRIVADLAAKGCCVNLDSTLHDCINTDVIGRTKLVGRKPMHAHSCNQMHTCSTFMRNGQWTTLHVATTCKETCCAYNMGSSIRTIPALAYFFQKIASIHTLPPFVILSRYIGTSGSLANH